MKKCRFVTLLGIACAVLIASGCLPNEEKAAQQQQAMPPPYVTVHEVTRENHPYDSDYQGVTQGSKAVEIRARVQAIIEKRLYTEGQYVEAGQLLFQLERDQYEAFMAEATSQYERARREWDRVRPLYAKNAVSQKERDTALAAYESAQANMRSAQINLDYCQVTSPVSGYTGMEEVTPGNLASNNMLLTQVNQTDPLYVNFSFTASDFMMRMQLAAEGRMVLPENNAYTAKIRLVDGTMYPVEGKVSFVDTQVDQSMGVVRARAEFVNKDEAVLPGQYVRVFLTGAYLKDAILIPQKCVIITQLGSVVMVVGKDNIVEMRPVKVSLNVGQSYLVDAGLKEGEKIVLDGLVKARPGAPVSLEAPRPPQAQQGAAPAPEKQ